MAANYTIWAQRKLAGREGLVPVEVPVRRRNGVISRAVRWKNPRDIKKGERELKPQEAQAMSPEAQRVRDMENTGEHPSRAEARSAARARDLQEQVASAKKSPRAPFDMDDKGFPVAKEMEVKQQGMSFNWEGAGVHMELDPQVCRQLGTTPQKIAQAFSVPGYEVQFSAHLVNGDTSIAGEIYNSKGELVGNFARVIERQESSRPAWERGSSKTLVAVHDTLKIKKPYRKLGIATNLLANSVAFYKSIGVSRIELTAGLEDGPFVWAKMGFDKPASKQKTMSDLIEYTLDNAPEISHTGAMALARATEGKLYRVARLEVIDGRKLGEEFIKGTSLSEGWMGVLHINDPADEGWQIFSKKVYGK